MNGDGSGGGRGLTRVLGDFSLLSWVVAHSSQLSGYTFVMKCRIPHGIKNSCLGRSLELFNTQNTQIATYSLVLSCRSTHT